MSQTKAIVETIDVSVNEIKPSPYQPRMSFNLEDIRGSVQRDGLLVPLTARKRQGYFELIDGERRLRLAKELGYATVPVTVIAVDDDTARRMVWKVNTLRQEYTPKEKAYYFKTLQEGYAMSLLAVARECDENWHVVKAHLNVLKLKKITGTDKYEKLIWAKDKLSVTHIQEMEDIFNGRSLDSKRIITWLERTIEQKLTTDELRKARRPEVEETERQRVESAKKAVGKFEPELKEPETPEEFEQAAKALKKRAEELKTPEQKHQELIDKAQKALSSFPSLEKAEKLGVAIEPYKEKLEEIESYLKEKPKEAWDDVSSLKKEFKAEIKEAEIRKEEEEEKRREEEMQRRIEEEAKKRARELEEVEKRRIEEDARKKAQEEILSSPELLQEVSERAREVSSQELLEMDERARQAVEDIAGPLEEALLKADFDIKTVKNSKGRRLLENYMIIGSILSTLGNNRIFCLEHENERPMLVWKCGTPLSETHSQLKKKLGMG